jgi:dTDP-4-amino-4,6-dideoxygalactose transaminase
VAALEKEVARYTGAKYAVGVASGSDALTLSLMAAGVGPGDRVVTTPFTFFATAGSIAIIGAVPVFVDIKADDFNIDPVALEKLLKKRSSKDVKAVIPVHLYGRSAEMDPIRKSARKRGIAVIEDAAQSIGAKYGKHKAGAMGDMGCLSFYPTKNLGCFGDGGMVTTNTKKLYDKLRMLRVHGSPARYVHTMIGTNSRLDELQAAVLRVKLKKLKGWTDGRIRNARLYGKLFKEAGVDGIISYPVVSTKSHCVFNQYVIRAKRRDAVKKYLAEKGVGTDIYYPTPLHLQKSFAYLGYKKGDFPISELAAKETLALPIFAELRRPR